MTIFIIKIFIISVLLFCIQLTDIKCQELQYKQGKPTSEGIKSYIRNNEESLQQDYQKFIQDTLEFLYLETDNLSTYYNHDTLELGYYYIPNEIIISNETLFLDYELKYLSKWKKNSYNETNRFVRATVMHELTHYYFYTVMQRMKREKKVSSEYLMKLKIFPNNDYGTEFIEEGCCEYVVAKMLEMIVNNNYKPRSIEEIIVNRNKYDIKYRYSRIFVQEFLDKYGLKVGIEILLANKPPTIDEILYPEKFYNRLIIDK